MLVYVYIYILDSGFRRAAQSMGPLNFFKSSATKLPHPSKVKKITANFKCFSL